MAPSAGTSFLDRPIARFCALLCFLLAVAALAYIHRRDLFPAASSGPAARCLAERTDDIDRMLKEGVIDETRAEAIRERIEAFCRGEAGG